MAQAYIGLGSNEGDRQANIEAALEALSQAPHVRLERVSPLLETTAVGGPAGQGAFLNAAAVIETDLEPLELLDVLQEVERRLGRQRTEHWQPRAIDLDLLLYDQRVIAHPRLNVPHLRLRERRFVLEPLAAVAGEAIDPVTGLSVRQLLERL
jgi:2-amino-4-hydroxy-6-hydroxymethyldihydropteridine diphosphokinase